MTLAELREEYRHRGLRESDVDPDPLKQFLRWFEAAREAGLAEPNAMTLATATRDGVPSARVVLLKGVDERGFVFYTNYESEKGRDLRENPRAALTFFWHDVARQVRISGTVERVNRDESRAYFESRPVGSRIGAAASRQSSVLADRESLEREFARLEAIYPDGAVPLPDDWGGYRVAPAAIEFWQGQPSRLPDRLRYLRQPDGSWRLERLSP
jgi:pyridoxamine 5'-phosphate oxidase